ncbi:bifunctional molybdenum cofactor biosynthesis protein MoaC/MogA [compost metagenome]
MAWLSRAEVVQLDNMLVFALPGSPKAAAQCLDILAPVLGHALAMVEGGRHFPGLQSADQREREGA